MPILETLWSYLNWTPRQQRPPTPPEFPVQQSPLSHGVSELCQWSQIPGVDGAADWDLGSSTTGDRVIASGLSLGSDRVRGSAPLSAETRYAGRFSPGYRITRPRPRRRLSIRRRFGMNSFSESQRQLRTTDQRNGTDRDYQRLVGQYSAVPPDATTIVPGDTFRKKKPAQNLTPFKPVNTLSGKRKESGPVRARGRASQRPGLLTYSRNSHSLLPSSAGFERFERPAKRQRRDHTSTPRKGMSSDDDIIEQVASSSAMSSPFQQRALGSPDSNRLSNVKGRRRSDDGVGEYRQVEQSVRANPGREHRQSFFSASDCDERFTGMAASQRKAPALDTYHGQAVSEGLNHNSRPEILESVEIPALKESTRGKRLAKSPLLQEQFIAADGTQRNSDMRDSPSPDVLQGEKTVNASVSPVIRSPRKGGGRSGVRLHSSPSDIQPTNFTTRKGNQKKLFEAVSVRAGAVKRMAPGGKAIPMVVDTTLNTIGVGGNNHDPESGEEISLRSIRLAVRGARPSRKVMLHMRGGTSYPRMDIELSSEEDKESLCVVLRQKQIEMQDKDSKYMDDTFMKGEAEAGRYAKDKRFRAERRTQQSSEVPQVEAPKRPKLSASLQDGDRNTNDRNTSYSMVTTHKDRNNAATPRSRGNNLGSGSPDHQNKTDSTTERPANNPDSPSIHSRKTRSMRRREVGEPIVCDDEKDDHDTRSTPDMTPGKWKKALVYPRFGKKMAEVDAQDRERLRDGEFLNDNLIGFYIRFLQEHLNRTNKDVAKRVYFFNSYFFATITNTSKGQRGVNYEGVQKWTRNVNLFSYDYIVVPINESAHWYVAIICNLPSLQEAGQTLKELETSEGGSRTGSEAREIPESPDPSQVLQEAGDTDAGAAPGKEELARQSFATMSLSEDDAANDSNECPADEWPEHEENSTPSPAVFSAADKAEGAKKGSHGTRGRTGSSQKRKDVICALPSKYNGRQPTIVTFDSLNMGRSPTINVLKTYLCLEAKSKRGVEIDRSMIKGMKAQQIPHQGNFSDCGLYLLAYVEKFAQDPDEFMAKLLRKEMKVSTDWPSLESRQLRRRLRNFLDELYDEQEDISPEKADKGATMADRRPVSFLLGSEPSGAESGTESPSRGESAEVPEDNSQGLGDEQHEKQTDSPPGDHTPRPKPKEVDQRNSANTEQMHDPPEQVQDDGDQQVQEVIEVPDSQDAGRTTRPGKGGQREESELGNDAAKDVVSLDDAENQGRDKAGVVEVQVSGTPSPKSTGRQRVRSPRANRKD